MKAKDTNPRPSLTRRAVEIYNHHDWQILSAGYVMAFLLGTWGFYQYFGESIPGTNLLGRILNIIYLNAQLFILESGIDIGAQVPLSLQVARLLAPAILGFTAITALMSLFGHQVESLRLRKVKDHIIVCGLGRKGMQLVREHRRRKQKVVVVEADAENDNIETARNLGATVVTGNAAEESMLARISAQRARTIYAVCGNQGANVETGIRLQHVMGAKLFHRKVCCYIHLVNPVLCHLLGTSRAFADTGDRLDMRILNTNDIAARLLFLESPLDYRPLGMKDRVRLIVAGFGGMGESVVMQAARIGHFANHRKINITVLDREARAKGALFIDRYPNFREAASIEFVNVEFKSEEFRKVIRQAVCEQNTILNIAICINDNTAALDLAMSIYPVVEGRGFPVHVRLDSASGLALLLQEKSTANKIAVQLNPFGMLSRTCSPLVIEHGRLDRLAMKIHQKYVQERKRQNKNSSDASMKDWNYLNPSLQNSNRHQADHIEVKLRAIGCCLRTGECKEKKGNGGEEYEIHKIGPKHDKDERGKKELELLAAMEHDRWNAERFIDGWRYDPDKKDVNAKISPYLKAWEELPPDIQQYDLIAVQKIPELAESTGMKICRKYEQKDPEKAEK